MGNKYETRAHNIKTANDANSQWMDEDFGYGFGKSFHYLVSIPKLKKKKNSTKHHLFIVFGCFILGFHA